MLDSMTQSARPGWRVWRAALLGGLLAIGFGGVQAAGLDAFLAAERALERGDRVTFERLLAELDDHPLRPYLVFADLTRDLARTSDAAIERFLAEQGGSQLAGRLRRAYLERLAKAGRWADYARLYRDDGDIERRCLYGRALLETGARARALEGVEPLWLTGQSRPAACDALFAAWRTSGGLTPRLIWARIRLALEAGEPGLARYLGRLLPEREQLWRARWMQLDAKPEQALTAGWWDEPHAERAALLAHAIARLATREPDQAQRLLERHGALLAEDAAASDRAHAALGVALTERGSVDGLRLWNVMRVHADNLDAQERRLRAAVGLGAWSWVVRWVEAMPPGGEKTDRWRYWQGRAEEALGQHEAAVATFRRAAEARSLWGFLAAERVGRPYRLDQAPTPADPVRVRALRASPAFQRILALRSLGRLVEMRREWQVLTADLGRADLLAAARLADEFGWHDRAILTLARTDFWDDLALRFPLEHRAQVEAEAARHGLAPEWIFAVIRQESLFTPDIASHAGAVGLMQLLPETARALARARGEPEPSTLDLIEPTPNIALGSAYLARLSERFDHVALATAAYNAGPGRVARWRPERAQAADLWILSIPFAETRAYVERVLAYRLIYAARLGRPVPRLSELLKPVPAS
ncbi:MAG: transglycosylase SLT domain-containing protein [Chromatiaceae bacterium]|nr:transglycosylase SLT domain-containing protein [Chromatiaceae bacterium]